MHEGDDGRVSHTANAPVFQIEHRHTDQLREKQKVVRHRIRAPPRSAIPNMAHPRATRKRKSPSYRTRSSWRFHTTSNADPIKIRAALRPTQMPGAPQRNWKQSRYATGRP